LSQIQDIFVAVPSHAFREVMNLIKPFLNSDVRIGWGTKGLDPESGKLFHEVVQEIIGKIPMAVLSGPSFAKEVALELPTAVTLANNNQNFSQDLVSRFYNPNFRVYTSNDMIGVQLCGAVKNVLAIAVGVSDGLNLGANARCALITRGLAEMARLGKAMGGNLETFMGLAGIGDLVLTATDDQSRNRRCGLALALGKELTKIQEEIGQVIEGATNAGIVYNLAKKLNVEMPIVEQVYLTLYENLPASEAVKALLSRYPKAELN
jgi:glycerol-3-phosphate dehydrogenase (NAD(P)+)